MLRLLKSLVKRQPALHRLARMCKGHQAIVLEYPVHSRPRYGHGRAPHPLLHELISGRRAAFAALMRRMLGLREHLAAIPRDAPREAHEPRWDNAWLPGLDAAALYSLLVLRKPRRFLEVGSGHSTRFARRAVRDHGLSTAIISIDPEPRADVDAICDRVLRHRLEEAELGAFRELGPGDVLFIDSSHCCYMNSDVAVLFLDVLPYLPPGVLVHLHDVFLPYDYPPDWTEFYYSEQYMLATYLLARRDPTRLVFPAAFVSADPELASILDPLWADPRMQGVQRQGWSFWLET
jgi:hypothetical protein